MVEFFFLLPFWFFFRRSPETGKRDDGFVEPPRGDEVLPDWVGGVVSPGRLETNSTSPPVSTATVCPHQRLAVSHLDQPGGRVSALLKVLLSVLLLDLQSQARSQNPLQSQKRSVNATSARLPT